MLLIRTGLFALLLLTAELAPAQSIAPADPKANGKTKRLYKNMQRLLDTGVMFGHQDDLAYGMGWKYEPGRSDVKAVTGAYPAVYGWDLGHIELDSARNLDGVPFKKMQEYIEEAYKRGGVNTISWHLNNPVNGKSSWNTDSTVRHIIPGGAQHEKYKAYLDRVAQFVKEVKSPLIFRPFHEHTGNWFWWCQNTCSAEEYKTLWRFTVDYLRKEKKLHNLLIAYSASDFKSKEHYLERYPGDEYVDIMGFDTYCSKDVNKFAQRLDTLLGTLQQVALEHKKVPALTETGYEQIPDATWWTSTLLPIISKYRLSYVLLWRNGRPDHYYVPYPGQVSADDFKTFYGSDKTIFQDKLSTLDVYKK